MQYPLKLAHDIIHALKIEKPPVDINAVIDYVSKHCEGSIQLESHGFIDKVSGAHIRKGNKHLIAYNRDHHLHRQRFTIAHELGHLILEHAELRNNKDDDTNNPEETAANQFAAELLVPLEFLKRDFDAGVRDVKVLAQSYKVSEEMMWWRIMDTGLLKKL
jgi:Zn-dependent peptidase ImmA (M78 family)